MTIEISKAEHERARLMRSRVKDELSEDRNAAIEILRDRFLDYVYTLTNDELAERVVSQSTERQIAELYEAFGDEDDSEISDWNNDGRRSY